MAAVKSDNALYAEINQYFIIGVSHHLGMKTVEIDGKAKEIDQYGLYKGSTARKLLDFIDEKTQIRLFNEVLKFEKDKHVFPIRRRLKIEFWLR